MRLTNLVLVLALAACSKTGAAGDGAGGFGGAAAGRGGSSGPGSGMGGIAGSDPACMLAGGQCALESQGPCPAVGPQHCDGYPAVGDRPAVNLFCCLPCPDPALQGVRTDGGVTCVPVTSQNVCGGSVDHLLAATIHVTASTNSAPVDVVVYCDASAERTLGPPKVAVGRVTPKTFPAGSPEVAKFLADLDAAGDVSSFTIYEYPAPGTVPGCAKSASFGTVTTLSVQGKTSGDIQCMTWPSAAQAALASDCDLLASVP